MIRFVLNNEVIETRLAPGMVLLDFIRYHQHLMGTKIGCREGDCGACTVLAGKIQGKEIKYESMTSCLLPLGNAHLKHIVTIEGINFPDVLNPIQKAMEDEGATQCGFCTPGFVVSLAGYCLNNNENPIAAIDGNICRCTGYKSIERAAQKVSGLMKNKNGEDNISYVTKNKILPEYFLNIRNKLKLLIEQEASSPQHPTSNIKPPTSNLQPTVLGGGTDLYVQKHEELVHAPVQFLFDQDELNGIRKENNTCVIGGSATVTDLKESEIIKEGFPSFQRFAKLISSTPIRNMATIAGNFVNASPIGDMTIFFLALNATIRLEPGSTSQTDGASRMAPLRKFYLGYKKLDKKPDEFISQISFELPGKEDYFNFEKVSKRTHLDIASVNSAIYIKMNGSGIQSASLSAGGVGPIPMYLDKTSEFLAGNKISDDTISEAINIMKTEISPISDARGTKEYKTVLLGQLIKAHLLPLI